MNQHNNMIDIQNNKAYLNTEIKSTGDEFVGIPAKYDNTFTQPVLVKPGEYYGSIIRFNINTSDIPIRIYNTSDSPDGVELFADYLTTFDININSSGTNSSTTVTGNPTRANGIVDFGVNEDILYTVSPQNIHQVGTVRCKWIPKQIVPGTANILYTMGRIPGAGQLENFFSLSHDQTGDILLEVYSSDGLSNFTANFGSFVPTVGQTYDFELNYDFTTGETRLFIDGTQAGATDTNTIARTNDINYIRINGSNITVAFSQLEMDNWVLFNTIQHTTNFVPDNCEYLSSRNGERLTLEYQGVDKYSDVIFMGSANDSASFGTGTTIRPSEFNSDNRYFWEYNIQNILDNYNQAWSRAGQALNAQFPALGTDVPYFIFDTSQNILSLIVPYSYYLNGVKLFTSRESADFFTTFNVAFTDVEEKSMQFILYYDNTNGFSKYGVAPVDPPVFIKVSEYVSLFARSISSFKSLVFTTENLPVKSEFVSNGQNRTGFLQIITDFIPDLSQLGVYRQSLSFFQTGPYRLFDLIGTAPLYRVDYRIFWQDKVNDRLHELRLYKNSFANVKFGFFRKETFTS